MTLSRRQFCATGLAATALVPALGALPAAADADATREAVLAFTGGVEPTEGGLTINAPEIAENGNTVPVGVSMDAAPGDVTSITILAEGNPNPGVATFHFSAMSGATEASTRIRLASTQNLVAVAMLANGTAVMAKREVKVTIGGCGG